MKCKDIPDNVLDYVEGFLRIDLLIKFKSHIRECPECNAFVRTYKKITELSQKVKGIVVMPTRIKSELKASFFKHLNK